MESKQSPKQQINIQFSEFTRPTVKTECEWNFRGGMMFLLGGKNWNEDMTASWSFFNLSHDASQRVEIKVRGRAAYKHTETHSTCMVGVSVASWLRANIDVYVKSTQMVQCKNSLCFLSLVENITLRTRGMNAAYFLIVN